MTTTDEPVLPYAESDGTATAGHAGSDTSRERAVREARDGTVSARQARTVRLLAASGARGLTWKDLSEATGWHHGQSSGVLSTLHKSGAIVRLALRRDRSLIYVDRRFIEDRPISPYEHRTKHVEVVDMTREEARSIAEVRSRVENFRPLGSGSMVCLRHGDIAAVLAVLGRAVQ